MSTVIVIVLVLAAAVCLYFVRRKKLERSGSADPAAQPGKRSPGN